jgi:solute:Na+ symporter, SSS family
LNRTEELILGVGIPFTLLLLYEILASKAIKQSSIKDESQANIPETLDESGQNEFGIKVLGFSFMAIGLLFCILSIWGEGSALYLIIMGAAIIGLGVFLNQYVNNKIKKTGIKYLIQQRQIGINI